MIEKILSTSCLGMLLGYLSGYNLSYSASLIKLSLLLLILNFLFYFLFSRSIRHLLFKNILTLISVFLLFFLMSNIRGNILKKDFTFLNETVSIKVKVYEILVKDSTKIIKASILKDENLKDEKIKILRNIAIYTFSQENFEPDTILEIKGKLSNQIILLPKKENSTEESNQNSGKSFDLFDYWSTKNIDAISMYPVIKKIKIEDDKNITVEKTIYFYSYKFRNYFSDYLKKTMDSFDSGIVMAMLWGDENNISKETNNIFREAGISHILVLSGYNLSIVAGLSAFIFRKNKLKIKVILSLIFVCSFLLLAQTSAPVWRASLMSFYTLLAIFFLKPNNAKLGLWITCFLFFIYSPAIAMLDVSFHLSFLATLGIIYFYPVLENIIKNKYFNTTRKVTPSECNKNIINKKISNLYLENTIKVFLVTLSANILIAPYLIYQFGYFKFSAILLSFVITPLVPLIMLSGFLSGSLILFSEILKSFFYLKYLSYILYYTSKIFSFFTEVFINIIFYLAKFFGDINSSHSDSNSLFFLSLSYLIIFLIFTYLEFLSKITSD